MNLRLTLIAILAITCIGGVVFYKKNFTTPICNEKMVYIYTAQIPGIKEDITILRKALALCGIKKNQIIENPKQTSPNEYVKIFFDQDKFDECIKQKDDSLKIAVRLEDYSDEEDSKIIGIFNNDKLENLLELVEFTVKQPIECLIIFDSNHTSSKQTINKLQELAKIKGINLKLCALTANRNTPTILKEKTQNINAAIILPGSLVFTESELILEYLKNHKIPVFTNHSGLIREGALGGFDFDIEEISYNIAEIINSFFNNQNDIKSNLLEELYPQIHLNMDTIANIGVQLNPDLLDEVVTVGGADL